MELPLSGTTVLDLTRYLPGPFCTQMLADFGAQVIKIEDPRGGELGRHLVPEINGESALFYTVNRNKKSVTLDLKQSRGREILKRLAERSDILVEQFRPGVMERLGLGYEELRAVNPGLIYCSISSYGHTGPMSTNAGHEINYLGLSGVMKLMGASRGDPIMPGVQIAGISGGSHHAVIAILMAFISRQQTGLGQYCDVSIMDGAISLLAYPLGEWSALGRLPVMGEDFLSGGYACYNVYGTADGEYMSLAAVEERFWEVFCVALERPEYVAAQWEPEKQREIKADITCLISQQPRRYWVNLFAEQDICFTPVLNMDEMIHHPQVVARDMIHYASNIRESGIDIAVTGVPFKLSATPGQISLQYPAPGQHNTEVFQALGYTREELEGFLMEGII